MITMENILREPHELLRKKSTDVLLPLTEETKTIIEDMIDYIFNSIDPEISKKYKLRPAVGLAAPQIGVNQKMLVIYCYDEQGNEHFYPMINPKILSYSEELTYLDTGEGCLSVDKEAKGYVHRHKRISVETYIYDEGELIKVKLRLKGYVSIVFQHEFDHLNGILFIDKINKEDPFFVPANSTPVKFKNE